MTKKYNVMLSIRENVQQLEILSASLQGHNLVLKIMCKGFVDNIEWKHGLVKIDLRQVNIPESKNIYLSKG